MALMLSRSLGALSSEARSFVAGDGGVRASWLCRSSGLEVIRSKGVASNGKIGRSCVARKPLWALAAAAPGDCSSSEKSEDLEDLSKSTNGSFWKNWQMNGGDLKEKVAKLGRAGLLAYGLFNGITYTTFFFIAFLGFEKTGQNPANNLKACLGGMISMWTGNNFTRPLRLAAAAALAPFMDKVLKKTQKAFKLADEASAFLFLVISLCASCGAAVGLLILSRLGR